MTALASNETLTLWESKSQDGVGMKRERIVYATSVPSGPILHASWNYLGDIPLADCAVWGVSKTCSWARCSWGARIPSPFARNKLSRRYFRNTTWLWEERLCVTASGILCQRGVTRYTGISPSKVLRNTCTRRERQPWDEKWDGLKCPLTGQSDSAQVFKQGVWDWRALGRDLVIMFVPKLRELVWTCSLPSRDFEIARHLRYIQIPFETLRFWHGPYRFMPSKFENMTPWIFPQPPPTRRNILQPPTPTFVLPPPPFQKKTKSKRSLCSPQVWGVFSWISSWGDPGLGSLSMRNAATSINENQILIF